MATEVYEDGDSLQIVVPSGVAEDRETIAAWLAEEPVRARVSWRQDARMPVTWMVDGKAYNLTTLIRTVIEAVTGNPARTQVWGPNWYQDAEGVVLHKVAEALPNPGAGGQWFDWTRLHELLGRLPAGRWTTYGDVAKVVGTGAQGLGQHITNCSVCPNAQRVLGKEGSSRPNFSWADPDDTRSQQQALEEEGVPFHGNAADRARRIAPEELQQLAGA